MFRSVPPFVVLDACVLMSTVQRQLLLRVADQGVFQPIWTERIGEEWRRNAARLWQIPPETLAEQWDAMNQCFPGAMEANTAPYEIGLRYSDPKDFHVIAAGLARRARCGLQRPPAVQVMTWNLKDFDRSELRRQGLDAYSPDQLLAEWWRAGSSRLDAAVQAVAADSVALGHAPEPLADTLQRERLHRLKRLTAETPTPTPTPQ
ncbi:PIN domain-containing protein [uncultured Castellaniella sp.]|uniref:PIN domain-containing protein n=1 Tax=uncultured Castellaniella sp. TaxID=647907 RepID=UPI002635C90A|nr:PIN domain-containing protein [uncultured Castellaniella sp.]